MDAIFQRRSVRKFTDQEVNDDQIRVLLEAAQCAPHAGPKPTWRYYVIKDKKLLNALSVMTDYSGFIKNASLVIVVAGDLSIEEPGEFWVQECSAASMNILTVAEELGLGAVWIGLYPIYDDVTYVKNNLGLDENIIPLNMIPVGYPAKHPQPKVKFREELVQEIVWDDVHGENPNAKHTYRMVKKEKGSKSADK